MHSLHTRVSVAIKHVTSIHIQHVLGCPRRCISRQVFQGKPDRFPGQRIPDRSCRNSGHECPQPEVAQRAWHLVHERQRRDCGVKRGLHRTRNARGKDKVIKAYASQKEVGACADEARDYDNVYIERIELTAAWLDMAPPIPVTGTTGMPPARVCRREGALVEARDDGDDVGTVFELGSMGF